MNLYKIGVKRSLTYHILIWAWMKEWTWVVSDMLYFSYQYHLHFNIVYILLNTNVIDIAKIWINLREKNRTMLPDPIFSPLIKLTHLGIRIEWLCNNFISNPFYLSNVNDIFSLRKKESQSHSRFVSYHLSFQWDKSSHATRFISQHLILT